MKRHFLFLCLIVSGISFLHAQTSIIWEDDFENGSGNWLLNIPPNGDNQWIVNNSYTGLFPLIPDTPTQPGGITNAPQSSYLHITNLLLSIAVDNANYEANSASDNYAQMIVPFTTLGFNNVQMKFYYLSNGSALDFGTIEYSLDAGISWIMLPTQYQGVSTWTQDSVADAAFDNQPALQFRFRWQNNGSGAGTDPPFSIDQVVVTGDAVPLENIVTSPLPNTVFCPGDTFDVPFVAVGNFLPTNTFSVELSDALGSFASPTIIGAMPGTGSGIISATMPPTTPPGNAYRVRVVSSDPPVIGTDNGTDIIVNGGSSAVITGPITVCSFEQGVTYTASGSSSGIYNWSVTGGTLTSGAGTNTITIDWGGAGMGMVSVGDSSAGLCGGTTDLPVTIIPGPPAPTVTGTLIVCENTTGSLYTAIGSGDPNSQFTWTVTGGTITSGQGSPTITIDWGAAGSGQITVFELVGTNCPSPIQQTNITIQSGSGSGGTLTIIGPDTVCDASTGVVYEIQNPTGTAYTWSVTGGTLMSGAGTSMITVNWGIAGIGSITVSDTAGGPCGGSAGSLGITILPSPPTPSIDGLNQACEFSTNNTYSIPPAPLPGIGYNWTVSGGTITSGQGSSIISVDWGAAGTGVVTLSLDVNGCSTLPANFTVNLEAIPAAPIIMGPFSVCENGTGLTYNASGDPNSTFDWTVTGGTIVSGQGTQDVSIDWGTAGTGQIEVQEVSAAGCVGTIQTTSVSIQTQPPPPIIVGPESLCGNVTQGSYTAFANAGSSFNWSVSSGSVVSGAGTNTVIIDWTSLPGTITLVETLPGGCNSSPSTLNVSSFPAPQLICPGDVQTSAGAPYEYLLNIGAGIAPYSFGWDWGDGTVDTFGNPLTHVYQSPGTYTVNAFFIDANGCIDSCNFTVDVSVAGALSEEILQSLSIYPNPADDYLTIEAKAQVPAFTIEFTDIRGVILWESEQSGIPSQSSRIDIAEFPPGIYLVKLTFEEGSIVQKVFVR